MTLSARNLNAVPVLRALLDEGSVVGAAERVGLSQPTVSGILARLRKEFNDPLLVRVGRTMSLTPRAEELRPQVIDLCDRLERLYEPPEFDPAQLVHTFVIAAPEHLSLLLTPRLLERLGDAYPGVRLEFVDVSDDLEADLSKGFADLAVCANFDLWEHLCFRPLFTERVVAAMDGDHPLADRSSITLAEMTEYPCISNDNRVASGRSQPLQVGVPELEIVGRVTLRQFADAVLLTVGTQMIASAPAALVSRLAGYLPVVGVPIADAQPFVSGLFWSRTVDAEPKQLWMRSLVAEVCLDGTLEQAT